MGFFDRMADHSFKKDMSGKTLFYPWGILGSGFIIESDKNRDQIRSTLRKIYIVIFPLIIIFGPLNLVLVPIFTICYYFYIKKITKDIPATTEKLKISKIYDLSTLILLEVVSIGFMALGFWGILYTGKKSFALFASIGFCGLVAIVFGYMIVTKIRSK